MKRFIFILAVVLSGVLVLTACTCTPLPTGTATPTGTVTPTVTPGTGTLNLYGTDPVTLDPAVSAETTSHQFIAQIYSGLVRLDEELATVPDIAASWDISQDRLVYTFHLRDDVVFQDGRSVTAADFEYSWERACSPATGSGVA